MKKFAFITTLSFFALSAFAGDVYLADRNHSEARFEIRHLMSKVSGKFSDVAATINIDQANPAASTVEFSMKTASVNTGSEGRDKHLKTGDFFDSEKFPEATFKSTEVKPTSNKNVFQVTGDFTLRGVTKHITVPVEFLGFGKDPGGNMRAGFSVKTTLNRKDYGVNWNKSLDEGGFLLADDVDVTVNIEAAKKKAEAPAPAAAPKS